LGLSALPLMPVRGSMASTNSRDASGETNPRLPSLP